MRYAALGRSRTLLKPKTSQSVFVVVAGSTPLVAFEALSHSEAISLLREEWLLDDLRTATVEGQPIWDGKVKLTVRRGTAEEAARYHQTAEPSTNGSGDLVLVYLLGG